MPAPPRAYLAKNVTKTDWLQDMRDKEARRRSDAKMTMAELVANETVKRAAKLARARQAEQQELALIARRDPAALAHHRYTMRYYHGEEPPENPRAWTNADVRRLQNTYRQHLSPTGYLEDPRMLAKWRAMGSYALVVPGWRLAAERALERVRNLFTPIDSLMTDGLPPPVPEPPTPVGIENLTDEQLARRDKLVMKARRRVTR